MIAAGFTLTLVWLVMIAQERALILVPFIALAAGALKGIGLVKLLKR